MQDLLFAVYRILYSALDMKCDQTRQISTLALHTNALRYCTSAIGSPIIQPYAGRAGARDADKLDVSR